MFQQWIKKLQLSGGEAELDRQSVEQLTALLLIEIARSDTEIEDTELTSIRNALKSTSVSLSDGEIDEIIEEARRDADTSVSLHTQLFQINKEFSHKQKISLVKQMWVVAMADGDLDKYEEYMIRNLSDLLHVSHSDFIRVKLQVIES